MCLDCQPPQRGRGLPVRPKRGRGRRLQAQDHPLHADQELLWRDHRRHPAHQQVQRLAVHQERRELRRGVRHLLRHGHPQHAHVREGGGGGGQAERHAGGAVLPRHS